MTPGTSGGDAPTLGDYGRVLRRRAWVIAVVVFLALSAAVAYDMKSTPLYQASAQVLLSRDSPAARLTGTSDEDTRGDPERFIQTQRQIARTDKLARRVLVAADVPDRKPAALLGAMKVVAPQGADVLEFQVQDSSGALASRLARSYARQFAEYQGQLDEAALDRALVTVEEKIAAIEDEIEASEAYPGVADPEALGTTPLHEALVRKKLQLQTLAPLETGKTLVLSASDEPAKVRPRPKRDLMIAMAFGLLVGVLLAFVLEAVDRRVNSVREIASLLGVPLLGQVRLQGPPPVGMVPPRNGPLAEGYEVLRGNFEAALEAVALPAPGTVVLATSGTKGDGQPSVIAGLSTALARSGKRVILVDLEPSSSLARLFGVPEGPGAVDVAWGETSLDDALIPVDSEGAGVKLLPLGTTPGLLGWLLSSPEGNDLATELRECADLVILNAPPLLSRPGVGNIAASVDAVLVVVSANGTRERMLRRLCSDLARLGPLKLGFVATGTAVELLHTPDVGHVVPIAGSSFLAASGGSGAEPADDPTHGKSRARQRAKT